MKRKIFFFIGYSLFLTAISLTTLEILFRYQVFDFYQFEFNHLNSEPCQSENTILIFGDSFSAYPEGYIDRLRSSYPSNCIVNAAIPGTGMRQHELLFNSKIEEAKPEQIIYQFYVGNDFLDIAHSTNYEKISTARNVYWELSEKMLFLQYLNFKLARFKPNLNKHLNRLTDQAFSTEWYNRRTTINFQANPAYLKKTISLQDEFSESYNRWKKGFEKLVRLAPKNATIHLLLLPHCSQTSLKYISNMKRLGAEMDESMLTLSPKLYKRLKTDFPAVQFLDPLPTFQRHEKQGNKLYFENDPHLNPEGQKVLSQFIQKNLFK